jgi:hypothetical protein
MHQLSRLLVNGRQCGEIVLVQLDQLVCVFEGAICVTATGQASGTDI